MNKNYISTDALHGLDYLAHARVYSHKYIRREARPGGGYLYYYPTDINSKTNHTGNYLMNRSFSNTLLNVRGGKVTTNTNYREADKASQIYREGLSENNTTPVRQNIAQQAISSITTAAKNTYNAGKDFIKNLFSNAVTENYTITDTTTGQTIASGTRPSTMSAIAKDTYNAGINFIKKLFSTPIITTNKTITVTETRGEMRSPSRRR